MFGNEVINKGFISKIYKQLMQQNIKKNKNKKMGRRPKQTFFQRRYIDSQKVHENMLNITIKRNANQNYNKVSPHTSQHSDHQEVYTQ